MAMPARHTSLARTVSLLLASTSRLWKYSQKHLSVSRGEWWFSSTSLEMCHWDVHLLLQHERTHSHTPVSQTTISYHVSLSSCFLTSIFHSFVFSASLSKASSADQTTHLYARVRDLHLLIDIIPRTILSHLSQIIYDNVTSLTLIANRSFDESTCLTCLSATMNSERLQSLTIQLDNCSQGFLSGVLETFSKLHSLTLSTYQSWSKLIDLSTTVSRCSIRSLNVYELFVDFDRYESIHQLCRQLEILSVSVGSIDECYRFLTLLLVGHAKKSVIKLRSLTIKCDFAEPDVIAEWLRVNVPRRLSYRCTTSVLAIWLWWKRARILSQGERRNGMSDVQFVILTRNK